MKNAGDSEELGRKDDLTAKEAGLYPASFIYVSRLEQDSLLQLDVRRTSSMSVTGLKRGCDRVWAFHLFEGDDVAALVDRIHEWRTIHDHRVDHVSFVGTNIEDPCRMTRNWTASWENPPVGTRHNRDCVCVDNCGESGSNGLVGRYVGVSPCGGKDPVTPTDEVVAWGRDGSHEGTAGAMVHGLRRGAGDRAVCTCRVGQGEGVDSCGEVGGDGDVRRHVRIGPCGGEDPVTP